MFINRLINNGPLPAVEQMVHFTEQRQALLNKDVVNLSTPNYNNEDLSLDGFQKLLSHQVEIRDNKTPAERAEDDNVLGDVRPEIKNPNTNIMFHDGNNRSVEQLMSDQAQNALLHNMMIELLRKQFSQIQEALREKVG